MSCSLLLLGSLSRCPLGVVSAPLYDSTTQRFAGMFTLADVVHLIQYYYLTAHEYENVVAEVEAFQLESLRSEFGVICSAFRHLISFYVKQRSNKPSTCLLLPPSPSILTSLSRTPAQLSFGLTLGDCL